MMTYGYSAADDRRTTGKRCCKILVILVVAIFGVISVCLCQGGDGGSESRVISDAADVISGSGAVEVRAKRAMTSVVVGEQLNVTVNWTRHSDDESLSALVSFRLQSASASDNHTTTVKLYWRTSTCNVHPGFKYCDLPNSDNSKTYSVYYNQACSSSHHTYILYYKRQ